VAGAVAKQGEANEQATEAVTEPEATKSKPKKAKRGRKAKEPVTV